MRKGFFVLAAWLAVMVVPMGPVRATVISLDTGIDVGGLPGSTVDFTFSATNTPGDVTNWSGWFLGIQVLPSGPTTGSVTLNALLNPAVNPSLTEPLEISGPGPLIPLASGVSLNGSTDFRSIGIITDPEVDLIFPGSATLNLATLPVTLSGDASGTWNVYVVQQNTTFLKSYYVDELAADLFFGNLPPAATVGESYSIQVGSISVVPEPTGGVLAVLGGGGVAAIAGLRRLRRPRGRTRAW